MKRNHLSLNACWAVVVAIGVIASPLFFTAAQPALAFQGSGNLLANPGFEAPFGKQCCQPVPAYPPNTPIDEVQVAAGWSGWWRDPYYPDYPPSCGEAQSPPVNCVAFHRPEWREASPYANRIRSGGNAQKYFTFWSVHEAGMFQTVGGIRPGDRLQFTAYMHAWSTNTNELVSSGQQTMSLKVGIDPWGGTNPFSANIVWSTPTDVYDVFAPFSVEAVAQSSQVTVFTYSRPVYPLLHNDVYVDDASLIVMGAGAPPPPPPPAPTAGPTSPPPASGTYLEHVVQRGEYLSLIAVKYGVKWVDLVTLNGLTSTVIYPGQVLRIPVAGAPTPTPPLSGNQVEYVVQPGDYLIRIAAKFGVRWTDILLLNALTSTIIYPGQILLIELPGD